MIVIVHEVVLDLILDLRLCVCITRSSFVYSHLHPIDLGLPDFTPPSFLVIIHVFDYTSIIECLRGGWV